MASYTTLRSSIILILCVVVSNSMAQIIINTDKGLVQGTTEQVGQTTVHKYLGIPFAQPPIGKLRFKPPQPLNSSWSGVFSAVNYGKSCVQIPPVFRSPMASPESIVDENCLYLNVFTTSPSAVSNKTVMVWIHGGGYLSGSGANWQPQTFVAMEDIIVVTINYRLGIFGFFGSAEPNPNNRQIQSNLGFLDQQLAMKWVQDNIEKFGGNKDAVTLAGFSVGSFSVGIHLVAPGSQGLYRYSIMESGAIADGKSLAEMRQTFFKAGQKAKCNSMDTNVVYQCLNSLNSTALFGVQYAMMIEDPSYFGLVTDGRFLIENPRKSFQNGRFHKGRLFIGTTLQDGYSFTPPVVTRPTFLAYVNNWFKQYPAIARATIVNRFTNYNDIESTASNGKMLGELANDALFLATSDFIAQQYSRHAPTYNYVWTYRTLQTAYLPAYMGVSHGIDVPYFYGYPIKKPTYYRSNFTAAEIQLSRDTMPMWGNFIRTGNPSTAKVTWPEYTPTNPYCLNISLQAFTVLPRFKRNAIAFFNQYITPQYGPPFNTTAPPTMAPTTMAPTTMATTSTVAQDSTFRIATFALIGVSGALFVLVIILLACYCCRNGHSQKV